MSLLLSVHLALCAAPTRLVVIQHGLYGDAVNMHVLRTQIESAASGDTLVHLASSSARSRESKQSALSGPMPGQEREERWAMGKWPA